MPTIDAIPHNAPKAVQYIHFKICQNSAKCAVIPLGGITGSGSG